MDRRSFHTLCHLLKTIGMLQPTRHMGVEEQVAVFLHILAHDVKNRVIKRQFMRSGETISRQFNKVLQSVLRCHTVLLKRPDPILQNPTDDRWKWFKNCLGALDGTHIKVNPLQADKARYRTRKGEIATNVLGVCSQDCQFIYVLPGWEGSAADSKVLRDAISRGNGLRVPKGFYYLADAGYMNGEGFLTPYRGQRYHLSEWRHGAQPTTPQEFFNMKHSQARNVIERCFGLLKGRWAIVRNEMPIDPLEDNTVDMAEAADNFEGQDMITHVESSNAWTRWRDDLAQQMFDTWKNGMAEKDSQSSKRINHTWTSEEDRVLVDCLVDSGLAWKGENGFRPGFPNHLEKLMHAKIPGCTLKGTPHITSRIKLLKKHYNAIAEMMGPNGGSGFGWNDRDKMIDVEKQIYMDWIKTHPNAKGLYKKPFPYYNALGPIFGEDMANGEHAEDPEDAVHNMDNEAIGMAESGTAVEVIYDLFEDNTISPNWEPPLPDTATEEPTQTSPVSISVAKKGKKRGRNEEALASEVSVAIKDLGNDYKTTNDKIDRLITCFEHQGEGSSKKTSVVQELKKFEILTVEQRVNLAMIMHKDPTILEIFLEGGDEEKQFVVASLLSKG
ncbi:uncharacterized protein LOC133312729 [Gastrolobium bilobum]|uniref:uncharacterized protein LOC133312729 n=1 Tax=Gastrolobium bilobum TaxID=150636 RepID=UPI002AB262F5|nr:uncharacterized protein LOC133312729 [Gastrolobium bilobum]